MLSIKSMNSVKSKMAFYVFLLLIFIPFHPMRCSAQKSRILKLNGNVIEFDRIKEPDPYKEKDPVTGIEHTKFLAFANPPRKLNGEIIYSSDFKGISKPKIKANDRSIADYIIRNTKPEFEKLEDGEYNLIIANVIINSKGKIIYFENQGVYKIGADIDETFTKKQPIIDKINSLLTSNQLAFEPATIDSKPVDYYISNMIGYRNGESIVVKKHKMHWKSIEEQ